MIRTNTPFSIGLLATSISFALFTGNAHAAAFGLVEQSITGLGSAFSSGSTAASDGSTIYFNPAGMSFLKNRTAVTFGANIIDPNAQFNDKGSTIATALGGASLNVNNEEGGDAGPIAVAPNFYYTRAINDTWTAGVGINAPFGLVSDYDKGWVGRYYALRSDIKTVNINPSIAYKASNTLSLGFGINIQYIDASLSNAIDFGSICAATQTAGTCTALRLSPQADDGKVKIAGDDWSLGFNLGLLWQASPATRIGLAYRSKVKHKVKGDADFDVPNNPATGNATALATGAGLVDGGVKANVDLPDNFSIGIQHQVNPKLAINADITWTNWSTLKELRFDFDNTAAADGVTTLEWEDSNRYSLGFTYQQNAHWTWRGGVAFDQSATPNSTLISPRVPDADRTWLTMGLTYKPSQKMSVDFGFAHLFIEDAEVNKVAAVGSENFLRGNLVGNYDIDVNIISAQARWRF